MKVGEFLGEMVKKWDVERGEDFVDTLGRKWRVSPGILMWTGILQPAAERAGQPGNFVVGVNADHVKAMIARECGA